MLWAVASCVINELGFIIFLFVMVLATIRKNFAIGELSMLIGFASTIIFSFSEILSIVCYVFTLGTNQFSKFMEFMNEAEYVKKKHENQILSKSRVLEQFEYLEFRNVHFCYPYSQSFVLKGVNFKLKRGELLSIVGVNGSGKSTIVKLMIGLYQPTKGEILLNGYPLYEYEERSVCRLFSVLFQTFICYPLTLRENIVLSDLDNINKEERIIDSIRISSFEFKRETFPYGLASYMTRKFSENGIELSAGQWQKVALARTYFKNTDVVIFDEPSSALDAKAEDQIFRNFYNISKEKTGIMISHRISSARNASNIIVLDSGVIEENGSHEELLKLDGIYAKLYRLQLEKYTINKGDI